MEKKLVGGYSRLEGQNLTGAEEFLYENKNNTLSKSSIVNNPIIKLSHTSDNNDTWLNDGYTTTNLSINNNNNDTLLHDDNLQVSINENYTLISDLLVFDDLSEYINRLNYSGIGNLSNCYETDNLNLTTINDSCVYINNNTRNNSVLSDDNIVNEYNWWALIFVIVPCLTLFGNVLVILAVVKERALQTVTNYFIVSLALADLLVAVLVMPFAVYVLVNGAWSLPGFVCDFYIATDVTCSTSSIFNLVAISIDRYIAVTQPIKYAKHKNNRRVWLTIVLVWLISAAIGSPIVLGLNSTPQRTPDVCVIYNSDFIIYSSLSSFYIPCIIMVFLYYSIFAALRSRAARAKANRKPNLREMKPGSIIRKIVHTQGFAETALGTATLAGTVQEEPTNTASGSNEDDDDTPLDPVVIISNEKSTEFFMATVVEEAAVVAQAHLGAAMIQSSGYSDGCGSSTGVHDPIELNSSPNPTGRIASAPSSSTSSSPPPGIRASAVQSNNNNINNNNNNNNSNNSKNGSGPNCRKTSFKKLKGASSILPVLQLRKSSSSILSSRSTCKKDNKNESGGGGGSSRFTIYKSNKSSKKKREKSSAKKERKATKTLAIVLGVFLICWLPFFSCNVMDALCTKLNMDCNPGLSAFIITSWLGYMNSFVNPVIYTVFNPEFRKAFRKLIKI